MQTPTIIGFIGDGQLARLSALAAKKLGFNCHFYGENEDGPCQGLGRFIVGKLDDLEKLQTFAKEVDVITLENEFIGARTLRQLQQAEDSVQIYPSPSTFALIENKVIEKESFAKAGLPVGSYIVTTNPYRDLPKIIELWGLPLMLKKSKGGYDGQGNKLLQSFDQLKTYLNDWQWQTSEELIVERFIDFEKEVAITVARNSLGEIKIYPVVDTIQHNHICTHVVAPAQGLSHEIVQELQTYAANAMEYLNAVGVFSFEFFITKNGKVLFNESAPRPHNSAHYSLDACHTSQFENHVRAITGLPLGSTQMTATYAVMVNILGSSNHIVDYAKLKNATEDHVHLHLYGKKESRMGRKMGHLTVTGLDRDSLIVKADNIKNKIRI